jgi:glycosyltransferase involved in cell wall biosynthesis
VTRILYIYGYPFFDLASSEGPAIHIRSTIKALQDSGNEMIAVVGTKEKKLARRANTSHLPAAVQIIRKTLIDLAELLHSLVQFVQMGSKAEKPDFIYERYSLFTWVGLALKRKWKIPYFVEFNDPGIETRKIYFGRSLLEPISTFLFKRIVSEADSIIAVSRAVAAALTLKGVEGTKIHIIPNGVHPQAFDPANGESTEISRKYHLTNTCVIGFVGGMTPWHGVNVLVQAAPRILDKYPNARFLIVGGEPDSIAEVQKITDSNGSSEKFIWTGWVPHEEVSAHLKMMDIVTAPYIPLKNGSLYFSPLKVFEYMAMGKPVVASRIDQLTEIFEEGKEIQLIEPGSVSELADAILSLIANPACARQLGLNAQKKVLGNYTWDRVASRIMDIFCKLSKKA